MTTINDVEERIKAFSIRCQDIDGLAWTNLMYWPGKWLVMASLLHIRGEGTSIEDALDAFDKALTALESRDRHLSETIGAPMPEAVA